jgi:protein TonB
MNKLKLRLLLPLIALILLPVTQTLADVFTDEEIASSVDVRDLDSPPRPKKQSAPNVPSNLRNVQASVQVGFLIDEDGRVRKPRVVKSSNPDFNDVAINCVRGWEFDPGKRDGQAVAVRVIVPLRFK